MARVDEILADLQQAKNLRILVLDSCRDNLLADELKRAIGLTRSATIARGLAKMESPTGTIISYSMRAGRTAADDASRNSPYTTAFLKHIEDKDEVATVFHRISTNVFETTGGTQVPELSLSFFGEHYLKAKCRTRSPLPSRPPPQLQFCRLPTSIHAPPRATIGKAPKVSEPSKPSRTMCGASRIVRLPGSPKPVSKC